MIQPENQYECHDYSCTALEVIQKLETKLHAAEVERDAALMQMRENARVLDKYEAGDDG